MFGNFVGQFLGGWIRGLKDKFVFFWGGGWQCWVEGVPFSLLRQA